MRKHIAIIIASLALFTGQAHAQRCLPKMQGIEVRANLADGFKPGAFLWSCNNATILARVEGCAF